MAGLCAAVSIAPLLGGATEAEATRAERLKAKRTNQASAAAPTKAAKPPVGPVLAVVSIAKQRIRVYTSNGLVGQSAVSTGQPGFRTPTGVFSVIQKNRWHRSNIYSGAPMPYMQRITWSGVALHAGVVPGYPASHGCIRLPSSFAAELWGMTKLGARVVVAPDDVPAIEVAHARLPAPILSPAPLPAEEANGPATERPAVRSAALVDIAHAGESVVASEAAAAIRLLNPHERALAARVNARADAAAKAKAAKAATEASAARAAEANKAIAALRAAELALTSARNRKEAAAKAVETAKTSKAAERATAALSAAEAKLAEAETAAEEARALEAVKTPEALAAAKIAWEAETASKAAADAQKAAERGVDPVSIFVSKKTGRVYIRQAWAPIHEAPVVFKDSELPVGTHLYVAVEPQEDAKAMRWLSVSLPPSAPAPDTRSGKRRSTQEKAPPAAGPLHRETAASVLDRFELPEGTSRLISEKLWSGASLIVSDHGISHETGTYTDFIVLTR